MKSYDTVNAQELRKAEESLKESEATLAFYMMLQSTMDLMKSNEGDESFLVERSIIIGRTFVNGVLIYELEWKELVKASQLSAVAKEYLMKAIYELMRHGFHKNREVERLHLHWPQETDFFNASVMNTWLETDLIELLAKALQLKLDIDFS